MYYLKEKRLSTQLVSVFSLSNSKRAKELLDWKNHESGDLSQVVFNLVSECVAITMKLRGLYIKFLFRNMRLVRI